MKLRVLELTRTLHAYLTMFASIVLFLFALTGFTLNHATWFGLKGERPGGPRPPTAQAGEAAAEPDPAEARPGRGPQPGMQRADDPPDGAARGAAGPPQQRGLLAKLTNLHKGKPPQWGVMLLVDCTAVLLMLGSLTGIVMLLYLPRRRRLGLIAMGVGTTAALLIYVLVGV